MNPLEAEDGLPSLPKIQICERPQLKQSMSLRSGPLLDLHLPFVLKKLYPGPSLGTFVSYPDPQVSNAIIYLTQLRTMSKLFHPFGFRF